MRRSYSCDRVDGPRHGRTWPIAREAGFTSHLIKPIRRAVLLEALALQTQAMHAQPLQAKPLQAQPEQICAVSVEAGMEDLVPGYLDKRRGEIAKYREALERGDFEAVRMLGHKLKGTGAGWGLPVLTEMSGKLEQQAMAQDAKGLRAKIEELARYVNSVKLEFMHSDVELRGGFRCYCVFGVRAGPSLLQGPAPTVSAATRRAWRW